MDNIKNNNQIVKADLEQWLKELVKKSEEYTEKVKRTEQEIMTLRVRNHMLEFTTKTMERNENVKADYLQSEKEKNDQLIKSTEQELNNLLDVEWKKDNQIRKLIENVEQEIKKIEASE